MRIGSSLYKRQGSTWLCLKPRSKSSFFRWLNHVALASLSLQKFVEVSSCSSVAMEEGQLGPFEVCYFVP